MLNDTRTDGQLLAEFAATRNEAAFEALVRRHSPMVLNVCRRVLRNSHDAEEAAQAAFLTLAQKASELSQRASVTGWLYRVAWYVADNARQAAVHRHHREAAVRKTNPVHASVVEHDDELPEIVAAELHALPEKYLQPLLLHHLQGETEAAAAQLLNLNAGTFSSRISRGRELLKTRLLRRGVTLPAAGVATLLAGQAGAVELPAAFVSATVHAASSPAAVSSQTMALADAALRALAREQWRHTAAWLAAPLATVVLLAALGVALKNDQPAGPQPAAAAPVTNNAPAAPQIRVLGAGPFQADSDIGALAFSPDGTRVAAGTDKGVTIWEIAAEKVIKEIPLRADALHFLSDGTQLLIHHANAIVLWDLVQDKEVRTFKASADPFDSGWHLMFPKNDEQVLEVINSQEGPSRLLVWNLKDAVIAQTLELDFVVDGKKYQTRELTFSPDGGRLATRDHRYNSGVREMDHGYCCIRDAASGEVLHRWKAEAGNFHVVKARHWLPDGIHLLADAFDIAAGRYIGLVLKAQDGSIVGKTEQIVAVSRDGKTGIHCKDGTLGIWDIATTTQTASFTVGNWNHDWRIALSADGRWFASAHRSHFLLVDLKAKKRVAPAPESHATAPKWVGFAADGRLLVSDYETTRSYDDASGALLMSANFGMASSPGGGVGCARRRGPDYDRARQQP